MDLGFPLSPFIRSSILLRFIRFLARVIANNMGLFVTYNTLDQHPHALHMP